MKNTGKELETLVAKIEAGMLPDGFSVELNKRVFDDDGVQEAEFDIVISGQIGSGQYKCLIECRDRPSQGAAPGSWIEQLVGRRDKYNFNNVMAVSTTGFARNAERHAREKGIDLRQLENIQSGVNAWFPIPSPVLVLRRKLVFRGIKFEYRDASTISADQQKILKDFMKDMPAWTANRIKFKKGVNSVYGLFKYMADGSYFSQIPIALGESKIEEHSFDLSAFDSSVCLETEAGTVPIEILTVEVELKLVEEEIPLCYIRQYSTHNGKPLVQRVEVPIEGGWDAVSVPFTAPNVEEGDTMGIKLNCEVEAGKFVLNFYFDG